LLLVYFQRSLAVLQVMQFGNSNFNYKDMYRITSFIKIYM